MQFAYQRHLEDFGVTGIPEPKKYSAVRPASLLEKLRIFYCALRSPVMCPNDGTRVRSTGRIIIEGQVMHDRYMGAKIAEGECGECSKRYVIAGTNYGGGPSPEKFSRKETLLSYIDNVARLSQIRKGEVYSL